jgi:hypothetical protein
MHKQRDAVLTFDNPDQSMEEDQDARLQIDRAC